MEMVPFSILCCGYTLFPSFWVVVTNLRCQNYGSFLSAKACQDFSFKPLQLYVTISS